MVQELQIGGTRPSPRKIPPITVDPDRRTCTSLARHERRGLWAAALLRRVCLLHQVKRTVPHRHHELAAGIVAGVFGWRVGQQPVVEIEALDVFERVANSVLELLAAGLAAL